MPSSQHRFSFFPAKNDKVGKITSSTCLLACFLICGLLMYVSYKTNNHGCNDGCLKKNSHHKEKLTREGCVPVCTSKECLSAADYILEKMDLSVDPCTDFYSFACGSWMKQFGENDTLFTMGKMDQTLDIAVKEILDFAVDGDPGSAVHKLKVVYDSCMSKNASELNAVPSALKFLERAGIPGWPHLESDFRFKSLVDMLAFQLSYWQNWFFMVGIDIGPEDDFNITVNDTTQLVLFPQRRVMGSDRIEYHKGIMIRTLAYFGIEEIDANATFEECRRLDEDIGKIVEVVNDRREKCQENSSLCESNHMFLNCSSNITFQYQEIICRSMILFLRTTELGKYYSADNMQLKESYYYEHIFDVLANHSDRVIANYIATGVFREHLRELNFYFRRILKKSQTFSDRENTMYDQNWKNCVQWAGKNMPAALAQLYVPKKLPQDSRDEIREIFEAIQEAALKMYDTNSWFDQKMLEDWNKSMSTMRHLTEDYIVYVSDVDRVNAYYREFKPTNDSYFMNVIEFEAQHYLYVMTRMKNTELEMLKFNPFIVNAYFRGIGLDLLFGILLPPVYFYGRPRSLNQASLGTLVGHEFGHSINRFLEDNAERPERIQAEYDRRKTCLVEQYDKYKVKHIDVNINGSNTFIENIADYFGIVLGELGYKKYLANLTTSEFALPAVNFTMDQTFYVSYAQEWCSVTSKEAALKQIDFDSHSPHEFRVLGTLPNSENFAKAFNCPVGSPMNPAAKCSFID